MVCETSVSQRQLVYPLFLIQGSGQAVEVASMPGIYRLTTDRMLQEMEDCLQLGLQNFILFPAFQEAQKDKHATISWDPTNFYLQAIRRAKQNFPEATIITDVAMDPYSSDGHDGLVRDGEVLNDETLPILAKMAVAQAEAGADIIGPSDMMDGRVGYLREALDQNGHTQVGIMAYTAKYASAFYGPFRDALDSAPKMGDKKTYQLDPANRREALIEAQLDLEQGADFLMVKPALAYLDVIRLLKDRFDLPIVAYSVSGEYAMCKAAALHGWLDEAAVVHELLLSIRRAGADIVITYHAKQYAQLLKQKGL
ncbi:MAG: porphobilinogen synthase [Bacteroidota bacterium]